MLQRHIFAAGYLILFSVMYVWRCIKTHRYCTSMIIECSVEPACMLYGNQVCAIDGVLSGLAVCTIFGCGCLLAFVYASSANDIPASNIWRGGVIGLYALVGTLLFVSFDWYIWRILSFMLLICAGLILTPSAQTVVTHSDQTPFGMI